MFPCMEDKLRKRFNPRLTRVYEGTSSTFGGSLEDPAWTSCEARVGLDQRCKTHQKCVYASWKVCHASYNPLSAVPGDWGIDRTESDFLQFILYTYGDLRDILDALYDFYMRFDPDIYWTLLLEMEGTRGSPLYQEILYCRRKDLLFPDSFPAFPTNPFCTRIRGVLSCISLSDSMPVNRSPEIVLMNF